MLGSILEERVKSLLRSVLEERGAREKENKKPMRERKKRLVGLVVVY